MIRIFNAIFLRIKRLYNQMRLCVCGGGNLHGISVLRRFYNFTIIGENNTIDVRSRISKDVQIVIYGNNHKLIIEEDVIFKKGQIWFEDHDCEICIGAGTSIEEAHLAVAENGTKLSIGKDCLISSNVRIATTDSHSIIDASTGNRTNPANDITIGNHVWLGYNVSINKGVTIAENSVIAGHSVVTKSVRANSIAAGIPAKEVKDGINWNRMRI